MPQQIHLYKNVNPEKIAFIENKEETKLKNPASNMIILGVEYDGNKGLYFQTPTMRAPYGIYEGFNNNKRFAVDFSLDPEDQKIVEFRSVITSLNKKLVDFMYKRPDLLKTRVRPIEEYEDDHFASPIRKSSNEKYNDTFKVSIPYNQETQAAYDNIEFTLSKADNYKKLTWGEITNEKSFTAKCIVKITGVWISPSLKKFGFFLKLDKARIEKYTKQPATYFIEDDSDDDNNENDVDGLDETIIDPDIIED